MHQYTCPKCKTVLKREQAIAAGKKIKCPKCQNVFAPQSGYQGKDEEDMNPYVVKEDLEQEDLLKEEKQRAAAGIVLDRFKKSKRGPALARAIPPAGWLTAAGVLYGIFCICLFVVGLFPLVFKNYYLDTPAYKKMSPEGQQEYWERLVLWRSLMMVGAVIGFGYASLICVGAFKMRTLESYGWAMTGAVMAMLSVFFLIGLWAFVTLRDPKVVEGFAEEPPPPI